MDPWQLRVIRENVTDDQWDILSGAVQEFIDCDRWDEFDYATARSMYTAFREADTA